MPASGLGGSAAAGRAARRRRRDARRARRRAASGRRALAHELELAEPAVPWHTDRMRVAELGAALASPPAPPARSRATSSCSRRPRSARWPSGAGGASSTMPQKRNPVASVRGDRLRPPGARRMPASCSRLEASTSARRGPGSRSGPRSATRSPDGRRGGARSREALAGLEVDAERMRENLDAAGGLVLAERIVTAARREARPGARRRRSTRPPRPSGLVPATRWSRTRGWGWAPTRSTPRSTRTYLGAAEAFVDRALAGYAERNGGDVRVHHRIDGADAPPLVLVQLAGHHARDVGAQAAPPGARFRVLRYDHRGHGGRRRRRGRTRSRSWRATCSTCSTGSGWSGSRSAASRSAARSPCGSGRTRRSASTGW